MIPQVATNAATRTVPILPIVPAARAAHPATGLTLAPGPQAAPEAPGPIANPVTTRPASSAPATSAPASTAPASSAAALAPSATPATVIPAATSPVAPPPSANAYFEWFQSCRCGHSSAWHGGAFGAAWRSGHQVQGACEAGASEGLARRCSCSHFGVAH
jgi:hypothetical protein